MDLSRTWIYNAVRQSPLHSTLQPLWRKYYDYKQKQKFDKYAVKIMAEVFETLNTEGIDCWLDFGTLLGAYREHNFILHDSDLDFGAFVEDGERLEKALEKTSLQLDHKYFVGKENTLAQISYNYGGMTLLDICFYQREVEGGSYIFTYICHHPSEKGVPSNIVAVKKTVCPYTGLKTVEFKGVKCQIPLNTEEYLIANYGKEFMTPDPSFKSEEATNVVEYSLEELSGIETLK